MLRWPAWQATPWQATGRGTERLGCRPVAGGRLAAAGIDGEFRGRAWPGWALAMPVCALAADHTVIGRVHVPGVLGTSTACCMCSAGLPTLQLPTPAHRCKHDQQAASSFIMSASPPRWLWERCCVMQDPQTPYGMRSAVGLQQVKMVTHVRSCVCRRPSCSGCWRMRRPKCARLRPPWQLSSSRTGALHCWWGPGLVVHDGACGPRPGMWQSRLEVTECRP